MSSVKKITIHLLPKGESLLFQADMIDTTIITDLPCYARGIFAFFMSLFISMGACFFRWMIQTGNDRGVGVLFLAALPPVENPPLVIFSVILRFFVGYFVIVQ